MNPNAAPVSLADENATARLAEAMAAAFADRLPPPLTVWLQGDLGTGKTTFVRALLRALGFQGAVKSPTYAIVESYPLPHFLLHHFDLYRFAAPEEWEDAGLDDLADRRSVCLIEWPDKGGSYTPPPDITLTLEHTTGTGRTAILHSHTAHGRKNLEKWMKNIPVDN